jgi:p-hydroxybenzoate 3-monooxygenase
VRADAVRPALPGRRHRPRRPAHRRQGLNLAVNDVRLLADALVPLFGDGATDALDSYSEKAQLRVWRAQDFSNYVTQLLHYLGGGPFERHLRLARLEYLERSEAAARRLAENKVGLPAAP